MSFGPDRHGATISCISHGGTRLLQRLQIQQYSDHGYLCRWKLDHLQNRDDELKQLRMVGLLQCNGNMVGAEQPPHTSPLTFVFLSQTFFWSLLSKLVANVMRLLENISKWRSTICGDFVKRGSGCEEYQHFWNPIWQQDHCDQFESKKVLIDWVYRAQHPVRKLWSYTKPVDEVVNVS